MKRSLSYIAYILFITLMCCVEPFAIKSVEYTNLLVVDGFISTDVKKHRVTLSRTTQLSEKKILPEKGALIWIKSGSGEMIPLSEVKPGIYETAEIAGVVGEKYQLLVTTGDGREYYSSEVTLRTTPPIDKIYAEFIPVLPNGEQGVQIYVDATGEVNTRNFRWDFIETYQVNSPYGSNYEWLGGNDYKFRDIPVGVCYPSDTSRNVLVTTTVSLEQNKVTGFPVKLIEKGSLELFVKYSMLLKQYSLSEEGFKYWDNLRIINESQGSLYDAQPGVIRGNLFSQDDSNEIVLGYFDACVVSEKRVFFTPFQFTPLGFKRPTYMSNCAFLVPTFVPTAELGAYMEVHQKDQLIWDAVGMEPNALFELLPKYCCDCTYLGTNIKPDFWE